MVPRSPRSLVQRLTGLVLGAIVLQTLLVIGILVVGGVIDQAETSAYRAFHDKVANRKDTLQAAMKTSWTNLDPYLANLRARLTASGGDNKAFFQGALQDLIPLLRTTRTTGVFVILEPEPGQADHPALYLRDYDPVMNSYTDDDLYLVYGAPEWAKAARIPMDETWQYRYRETAVNQAFYRRPFDRATTAGPAAVLGYWSPPFRLSPDDLEVLTYSMPLRDSTGRLRGVIGTEISLSYLEKNLPAQDLQSQDSLGYLIAFRDGGDLVPLVQGGALQRRLIRGDRPLKLQGVGQGEGISRVLNPQGKEKLFAAVEKIGLYPNRTPFEAEQWYLVGVMREASLLGAADRIRQILWIALVVAIVIGTAGGAGIAYQVTRPIALLARQVRARGHELPLVPTGLAELDELSQSIEVAHRRTLEAASRLTKVVDMLGLPIAAFEVNLDLGRVSVTDNFWAILGLEAPGPGPLAQGVFEARLAEVLAQPESHEPDVYQLNPTPAGASRRWIRFRQARNPEAVVGVVIDVTAEILEKQEIRRERDHDPLTLLLNRKGFQWEFEQWRRAPTPGAAALVMFDLDNLKAVNDTYGHQWGDQYIVLAVGHLRTIAPEDHCLLGRRSGDEFLLLLHGFADRAALRRCLEEFYDRLLGKSRELPDGEALTVSISAGLMWLSDSVLSYDELLHFADEALYVAKRQKKGTLVESER